MAAPIPKRKQTAPSARGGAKKPVKTTARMAMSGPKGSAASASRAKYAKGQQVQRSQQATARALNAKKDTGFNPGKFLGEVGDNIRKATGGIGRSLDPVKSPINPKPQRKPKP